MKRYLLVLMAAFLAFGCAHAPVPLNNIPLAWTPSDTVSENGAVDMTGLADAKLKIEKFTDTRKNPALIAENREKGVKSVTTRDDVAAYVTDHLAESLKTTGLGVVDTGDVPVLTGEIDNFFVTEVSTYHAEVTLHVTLKSASGKTLWTGIVGGSSTTFGKSYSAPNYYKVLSNAVVDAAHNLLSNPAFHNALAAK